jgi:hypothetical protein
VSWPMFELLIGAKSTLIFSQVLGTSPYLWLKSWTEELIHDLPNRGYEISDLTTYQQRRKRGDHTWNKQRGLWKAPHPTQYIYIWSGMMFWNLLPQNIEVREKRNWVYGPDAMGSPCSIVLQEKPCTPPC